MTQFRIDLSRLVAPSVVQALDFETIRGETIADFRARYADFDAALESDLIVKLVEAVAYRETLLRARVNDAAKAVMLASATGSDLDHLAALSATKRLEGESDADLRRRAQLAWEGLSTAGPTGAYIYHALSAHPDVRDASVTSPRPGEVLVTVLSRGGDGFPSAEILDAVRAALNDEDVRPLTDTVTVAGASILAYTVEAELVLYPGPAAAPVLAAAQETLTAEVLRLHALGYDVMLSALYAALHQPGVQRVRLVRPTSDILVSPLEAAYCAGVSVTVSGRDV